METGIHAADGPAAVAQGCEEGILPRHLRVAALGFAGDAGDVPHQEAGEVEQMQPDVGQGQIGHLGQIGLVGIDVEGMAERQAQEARRADLSAGQGRAQGNKGFLPAEVFVDDQRLAILGACAHRLGIGQRFGKGFLTDHHPGMLKRQLDQRTMRVDRGGDIDEIRAQGGQHGRCIGEDARNAKVAAEGCGLLRVKIADADHGHVRLRRPALHVIARKEPAANENAAIRSGHARTACQRAASFGCNSTAPAGAVRGPARPKIRKGCMVIVLRASAPRFAIRPP